MTPRLFTIFARNFFGVDEFNFMHKLRGRRVLSTKQVCVCECKMRESLSNFAKWIWRCNERRIKATQKTSRWNEKIKYPKKLENFENGEKNGIVLSCLYFAASCFLTHRLDFFLSPRKLIQIKIWNRLLHPLQCNNMEYVIMV